MRGKEIRLERIMNRNTKKTIIVPMDHGVSDGPIPGLIDIGQSVNLEVVCGEMTVLWRGKLVAEHDILPGRFGTVQVPSHLEGLVRKTHTMPGPNEPP